MQSSQSPSPSLSCGEVPARTTPLAREAVLCAAAAAFLASLLVWLGPPGADFAAHAYQRTAFLQHGFALWNNFWYAGRYSFITYSVIYYPLAALVGIKPLAVATVAIAALAFTVVLRHEWGAAARWSSWTFAVVWSCIVVSGAFPFALGAALALLAIWALQTGSRWKTGQPCCPERFAAFPRLMTATMPAGIANSPSAWRNSIATPSRTLIPIRFSCSPWTSGGESIKASLAWAR